MEHSKIGKIGEKIAIDFFIKNGYFIIAKNARISHKEVDLIITKNKEIRFIEVKTTYFVKYKPKNDPKDYVSNKKIGNLLQAIDDYSLILAKNKENIYADCLFVCLINKKIANISYFKNVL